MRPHVKKERIRQDGERGRTRKGTGTVILDSRRINVPVPFLATSRVLALTPARAFGTVVAGTYPEATMPDYTPYQQKIIKRYYNNQDTIQRQRLAELVTELYLSEGKKRQKVWASIATAMQKLEVPQSRIDHLLKQDNPALVAEVVKELDAK